MNWFTLLIISNLFVACLIACLASVVGRSGRRATIAHLLWLAVFIKLVTPPIVPAPVAIAPQWMGSFIKGQSHTTVEELSAAATASAQPSLQDSSVAGTGGSRWPAGEPSLSEPRFLTSSAVMLTLWAAGSCLLIGRGVVRFIRFSRLLRSESHIDREATSIVRQLIAGNAGGPRHKENSFAPEVRLISARVSPMLFGIGKETCIICPERLWQTLDDAQRQAFLAHETAHFLRRDHWVRWLEWLITATYWWLPLIYIARRQLERHEEAACDAWAISKLNTAPRVYAEALLNVVDYLSETKVGVPRLASRMQATDTLEERLRLIMTTKQTPEPSTASTRALAALCLALLVIHPSPYDAAQAASFATLPRAGHTTGDLISGSDEGKVTGGNRATNDRAGNTLLPPEPRGWWNEPPVSTWADLLLADRGLRLLAETGTGVRVQQADGSSHAFDPGYVCAMAYIPASGRLMIGNAKGELHLWDVASSQAVSLIGKHEATISSLAYHPQGGLVSGDQLGNLIAWDIQSGQMMGTGSVAGPVGSIRWSHAGDQLAVVVGDWASTGELTRLHFFADRSLQSAQSLTLPLKVAVVQPHRLHGWFAIDWSGNLWALNTGNVVGRVPKEAVSGMVLCQDLFDMTVQALELEIQE